MRDGRRGAYRRLAVVADDLTGAADAAALFASRGARVSLALSEWLPEDVDVVALVSDTRWRDPEDAAAVVGRLVGRARSWGAEALFVKVDSTLRGNVAADVEAALTAWSTGKALATPAFPAQGRLVRDGALVVHGKPERPRVADSFPPGVTVLDAETDADLARIAAQVLDEDAVAVGSAGLARALARLVDVPPAAARPPLTTRGVLVVVGTPHPVTRAQTSVLEPTCTASLVVAPGCPVDVEGAASALARGGRVLLTTGPAPGVEPDSQRAAELAGELAETVRAISGAAPSAGLVLTGGATALAVATALGASEYRLLEETSPGVVLGELVLPQRRVPTITKSGGFGARDALLEAVTTLEAHA